MKITTNKIRIQKLDRSKINNSFTVIKIFTIKNYEKKEERKEFYEKFKKSLEEASIKTNSVLFENNGGAFVLFKKNGVDNEGVDNFILNQQDCQLRKKYIDINSCSEIRDEDLLQLLANALPNETSIKENVFNNISGKLLVQNNQSMGKNKTTMYNITFDLLDDLNKEIALNISGVTFYSLEKCKKNPQFKDKISDKATYIVDKDTFKFRKFLKDDFRKYKESEKFIDMRPFKYQKNPTIAKFLSIEDYKRFHNSKCGMLYTFLNDFNSIYKDYLHIELDTGLTECEELTQIHSFSTVESLYPKLNMLGINVEDTVKTSNSDIVLQFITSTCIKLGIDNISMNNEGAKLKIKMIHVPEFYKKEDIVDQHEKSSSVQHVCIESFERSEEDFNENDIHKFDENIVKKILYEFGVKIDIENKKIDMFSFENYESDIKFVIKKYDKLKKKYIYYQIIVHPSGCFEYGNLESNLSEEYREYQKIFYKFSQKFTYRKKIEMVIFYNGYTIYFVDTGIKVFPNDLDQIEIRLKNYRSTRTVEKNVLLDYLEQFKILYKDKYDSKIDELICKVNEQDIYYLQYQDIMNSQTSRNKHYRKPMITTKGRFSQDLNEFLIQKGIVLNPAIRAFNNEFLNSFSKLHVLKSSSKNYYYYVASNNSLKKNYSKSNHIREIVIEGIDDIPPSDDLIYKLINQLTIDFVKNNEYSVTSFMNKYLHDCIELLS